MPCKTHLIAFKVTKDLKLDFEKKCKSAFINPSDILRGLIKTVINQDIVATQRYIDICNSPFENKK